MRSLHGRLCLSLSLGQSTPLNEIGLLCREAPCLLATVDSCTFPPVSRRHRAVLGSGKSPVKPQASAVPARHARAARTTEDLSILSGFAILERPQDLERTRRARSS